ncbi:MAG: hypothetical protein IKP40_13985 [Clostridia bacterium]|nr:hypothetical protein [Clostridia bacterium]
MSLRKLKRQAMRNQTKANEELRRQYEESKRALSAAETITGLIQQGVTPRQLEEEFTRGYKAGYKAAAMPTSKAAMAAAIIALKEVYGFGPKRCIRFLNVMYERMVTAITDEELVQEAFDQVGVEIDFGDPVEGVRAK